MKNSIRVYFSNDIIRNLKKKIKNSNTRFDSNSKDYVSKHISVIMFTRARTRLTKQHVSFRSDNMHDFGRKTSFYIMSSVNFKVGA